MAEVTVVFADLTGSTGMFEALGDAKAAQAVTRLTEWLGKVCEGKGGTVVKSLGDGLLMVFANNTNAVQAVFDMQRLHSERIKTWPDKLKMHLQVGLARGDVVEQAGDYFGDTVNLASRLSDLSGAQQILANKAVIDALPSNSSVRSRSLGAMEIRGRLESCMVYRLEWQNEVLTDFFTMPAELAPSPSSVTVRQGGTIDMSWLDISASFASTELPIHIGRVPQAQFVVNDPRVSRIHAKITWRAGKFYLEDVSSYGTWLRFTGSASILALRRQESVLLGAGEIALGASFEDFSVPTIGFKFVEK